MTVPMAWLLAAPAPVAYINGNIPKTIAAVVMSTGRIRIPDAFIIASLFDRPSLALKSLANCTINMPCLLINPMSVKRPTSVYTFNVSKPKKMGNIAPNTDKGTAIKMIKGSLKLSN